MRLRRPIAYFLAAAVAASALTGCNSFSGHAAAAANSAQVQQLIEFIADLGLERDLRQALQKSGDLRQALLTLLGLESAVNFNVDDLAGARPGQHAVQVWEVTAQNAEDAAALAASQIRAVLEQLKSNGVTEGRIGMVEVDGKYYVVVDVEVTEENTFKPAKPVSDDDDDSEDDDDDNEDTPSAPAPTAMVGGKTIDLSSLGNSISAKSILDLAGGNYNKDDITELDLSGCTDLTSIGTGAFDGCSGLTEVKLPSTVITIGNGAFNQCRKLTKVNLPSTVTTIGNGAFSSCTDLTSIDLPNSLIEIGLNAFCNCTGLTSISLPNSLTKISNLAFSGCTNLQTVTMGNVDSIVQSAFNNCTGLQTVTMGNVDSIGQSAFAGCTNLETVTMDNVNNIRLGAFSNCTNLTNICFSNSTPPSTGEYAFSRAGSSSGVNIYSNIKDDDTTSKTTVSSWFSGKNVIFHPYSPGPQNLPTLPSLL